MKNRLLSLLIFSLAIIFLIVYGNFNPLVEKKEIVKDTNNPNNKKNAYLEKKEKGLYNNNYKKKVEVSEKFLENENNKHYKTIKFASRVFDFDIKGEKLVLSLNGTNYIGEFEIVLKNNIDLQKIYSSDKKYLLSLNDKKYIISIDDGVEKTFKFKLDITYIKQNNLDYIISTPKGVFIFNTSINNILYFHIFSDFVVYNNSYLAIIKKSDNNRRKTFSIDSKNKDIIFYYNPKTKEGKIVYETSMSLDKIFLKNDHIYLEDNIGEIFHLKNI